MWLLAQCSSSFKPCLASLQFYHLHVYIWHTCLCVSVHVSSRYFCEFIDPKLFQDLHQHYHDLEWGFKHFDAWRNPDPYLGMQFQNDNLLTRPSSPSPAMSKTPTSFLTVPTQSLFTRLEATTDDLCNGGKLPKQGSTQNGRD